MLFYSWKGSLSDAISEKVMNSASNIILPDASIVWVLYILGNISPNLHNTRIYIAYIKPKP